MVTTVSKVFIHNYKTLKYKLSLMWFECPYESNGFFKRLYMIFTAFKRGEITMLPEM